MDQPEEKAGLLAWAIGPYPKRLMASGYPYDPRRPKHRVSRWIRYPLHLVSFLVFIWCMLRVEQDLVEKCYVKSIFRSDVGHAAKKIFDFDEITPSEKLEWYPCFTEQLKCARLTVPMDYNRPLNASADNPKVHIALLLVPGAHTGSKTVSTSPLLLNPGGPGGSGVMFARTAGSLLQQTVGVEQDIIGFDPRGIGATMPRADCFSFPYMDAISSSTEENLDYLRGDFHRTIWTLQGREIGTVNSNTDSLPKLDARAKSIAKLCEEKDSLYGKDSILKYLHTPSVARDMVSIVDAWDQWAESRSDKGAGRRCRKQAKKEVQVMHQGDVVHSSDTKGKLVYWGFSYGTLLGATFAAMFPDRVGRVILDGVVDADHYVAPVWTGSIRDSDAISNKFAKYCHEGKSACALWRPGYTVSDVEDRFSKFMADFKKNPIITIEPVIKTPIVLRYDDFRLLFFATLYSPLTWPMIAVFINMYAGPQREDLGQWLAQGLVYDLQPLCAAPLPAYAYPSEAQLAIMCSDKRYPLNETLPGLQKLYERMANESSWADIWMTLMIGCEGWKIKAVDPPMRWDDHPSHSPKPINTSNPVFFISNTLDPVTPLYAGIKMAKKFVGAGLLEQKSEGHCSLAARSRCTLGVIRKYLQTGEVPVFDPQNEEDRVKCEADEWPFHPWEGQEFLAAGGVDAKEEVARMRAMRGVQEAFWRMRHWGQPALPQLTGNPFEV